MAEPTFDVISHNDSGGRARRTSSLRLRQIPVRLYRGRLRGGGIVVKARSVALAGVIAAALACVSATLPLASSAAAAAPSVRCVGPTAGCYRTLQAAVDGARSGDSILISAGVFSGGVTIDKSVQVVGAGAGKTIITGGGPVLTIGRFGASREPVVSLRGVTVTGGVTHLSALSAALVGKAGVIALGGGVEIPPAAGFGDGATVQLRDSVITGNRVAPQTTVPSGLPCGCAFAFAGGGGVDNWGVLTIANTLVDNNESGGAVASDADAAGVFSAQGSVTVSNSVIRGNRAAAVRPNGRFAEGGGLYVSTSPFFVNAQRPAGTLTMTGSRVAGNAADLSTGFPSDVEAHAQAGGLFIGGDDDCSRPGSGCAQAIITDTTVTDNHVSTRNSVGDAIAFSGGVNNDGMLNLQHGSISANQVSAKAATGSSSGAFADSAGLGMGGYAAIDRSRINDNAVTATAAGGDASASFAGMSTGNPSRHVTVTDSVIAHNRLTASTDRGTATVQGAGAGHLDGPVLFSRTLITGNSGAAYGPTTVAQGGGIINLAGESAPLNLNHSVITANQLTSIGAGTPQGGGLYTTVPVVLARTVIAGNRPDQCFGSCP